MFKGVTSGRSELCQREPRVPFWHHLHSSVVNLVGWFVFSCLRFGQIKVRANFKDKNVRFSNQGITTTC